MGVVEYHSNYKYLLFDSLALEKKNASFTKTSYKYFSLLIIWDAQMTTLFFSWCLWASNIFKY
jgi:hypothetical protein